MKLPRSRLVSMLVDDNEIGSLKMGRSRQQRLQAPAACDVSKYLSMHASFEIPEQALWFAVIKMAITDLMDKTPCARPYVDAAREFFNSGRFAYFCDLCDLEPDFVMRTLRDHAGLSND